MFPSFEHKGILKSKVNFLFSLYRRMEHRCGREYYTQK